jgi:hypothetical protein
MMTHGDEAIVDAEDYEMLSKYSWHSKRTHQSVYAIWTSHRFGKHRSIGMHQMIMLPEEPQQVDHINGNGLDNRRCNLRLCSEAENGRNERARRGGSSVYKGVFRVSSRAWQAQCSDRRLGTYDNEIDAALAYDVAALAAHGEFANTNFLR